MTRTLSEQDRIALNAMVDGELDAAAAAALERRIAADAVLRAARESLVAGRQVLGGLERPVISDDFRRRIASVAGPEAATRPEPGPRWFAGWQGLAAAIFATAAVTSGTTYLMVAPGTASLDGLVASAHRRGLLAASPVDIPSSDRHTVKPWLDARLGVSPPAPDLAAQGFPLVGGRVEVLGQQPVPVLVYRHREHTITLAAIPAGAGDAAPVDLASGGFNMVRWRGDGFDFRAVSDLERGELGAFADAYRAATGAKPGAG